MNGPMHGITVIDLGTMIAGPMAATVLCDQGADVIKVEAPGIGDVMRYLGATSNWPAQPTWYCRTFGPAWPNDLALTTQPCSN